MATYRCLSCGGVYVDPQGTGVRFFHSCPPDRVDAGGHRVPLVNPRDENIVQDPNTGQVSIRAAGRGRELIDAGDALTGADPDRVVQVLQLPAIGESPLPEEIHPPPKEWLGGPQTR